MTSRSRFFVFAFIPSVWAEPKICRLLHGLKNTFTFAAMQYDEQEYL